MKSHLTEEFTSCFVNLPPRIQRLARKNHKIWKENPLHPGLRFKRDGGAAPVMLHVGRISTNTMVKGVENEKVWC